LPTLNHAPSFQPVTQSANAINLAWTAFPGMIYQVQYTKSLNPLDWIDSGAPITATNNVMAVSESLTSASQRFYRVIQVPQ
jgi:hypothetical protein